MLGTEFMKIKDQHGRNQANDLNTQRPRLLEVQYALYSPLQWRMQAFFIAKRYTYLIKCKIYNKIIRETNKYQQVASYKTSYQLETLPPTTPFIQCTPHLASELLISTQQKYMLQQLLLISQPSISVRSVFIHHYEIITTKSP